METIMNRVMFIKQNIYCICKKDVLILKSEACKFAEKCTLSFFSDTASIVKYFFTPK